MEERNGAGPRQRPTVYTVTRLENLTPGERMVYYRGGTDIETAVAHDQPRWCSPAHAEVLRHVMLTARRLEAAGKIHLAMRDIETEIGVKLVEYLAIGA